MRIPRTTVRPSRARTTIDRFRRSLASDGVRRLRRGAAAVVLIGIPVLMRIPILRRHPWLRWLEILGGVTVIAKVATALRDWEPKVPLRPDVE
jgi:hypothetical protein